MYIIYMYIFVYSSQNDIGTIYNPPDLSLMGKTIKIKFSIKGGVEKWHKGTVLVADLGF